MKRLQAPSRSSADNVWSNARKSQAVPAGVQGGSHSTAREESPLECVKTSSAHEDTPTTERGAVVLPGDGVARAGAIEDVTFRVTVAKMNGATLRLRATMHSKVMDLKRSIKEETGMPKKTQTIVLRDTVLDDTSNLASCFTEAHFPGWLLIADIVPLEDLLPLTDLILNLVVQVPTCTWCLRRDLNMLLCMRCRAPYCNAICQQNDWRKHRKTCARL